MKILIVGGTSSLSRAMLPVLSQFASVVTAGRSGCDIQMDLAAARGELNIPDAVDVVINTAAAFGGTGADALTDAEGVNALGVLRLCRACTRAGVRRLVLISSIFAQLEAHSPFFGIYALSKRHSEELGGLYSAQFGLPITVVRPSQFYGPGGSYRRHHPFLAAIIDKAARGEDILIHGKNDALRNFIHEIDVATAVARAVQRGIAGTYACMSPLNVRYSQVADAAIAAFGSASAVRFAPEKPDIPDNIFEPDDSLFRLIDYYPRISIEQGMRMEAVQRQIAR
jgi:nucleoside-diphosphate-sugar epimerase